MAVENNNRIWEIWVGFEEAVGDEIWMGSCTVARDALKPSFEGFNLRALLESPWHSVTQAWSRPNIPWNRLCPMTVPTPQHFDQCGHHTWPKIPVGPAIEWDSQGPTDICVPLLHGPTNCHVDLPCWLVGPTLTHGTARLMCPPTNTWVRLTDASPRLAGPLTCGSH